MKHLKLLLRSLIKNNACVEGGRTYPWWVAVIFFILSTAISLIPTTVSLYTIDAGVMITNSAYETDKGFHQILEKMEADNIDLKFYNEHTVEGFNEQVDAEGNPILPYVQLTGEWKNTQEFDDNGETKVVNLPYLVTEIVTEVTITNPDTAEEIKEVTEIKREILKLYVFDQLENEALESKVSAIKQGLNPYLYDKDENIAETNNSTSFIVFGKHSFVWMKYDANKKTGIDVEFTPVGQLRGTYRDVTSYKSLLELKGQNLNETVEKTAVFLQEGFNETKLNNAAIQLAIYLAINAGIVILMGFVLWLMTRGKNNPFRCYKFIETLKISTWTAFTPALLSMVLGFVLGSSNSMAGFMFIMLFGIRSMWLAMKNLRPAPTK